MGMEQMLGTGIQPQDNPSPIPGGAPPAQAQPTPSPDTQNFLKQMGGGGAPQPQAPAPALEGPSPDVQQFLKEMGSDGEVKPPEPHEGFVSQVKAKILDDLQDAKAKFRMGAARNETERTNALEKAFGPENIKVNGKDIMVRTEGSKSWKKYDEGSFLKMAEPFLKYGFNQGLASLVPGLAGGAPQALTQGAIAGAGAVAGAFAGGPAGAVAGGAAGGAAGHFAGNYIAQKENELLGQDDPNYKHDNKVGLIADTVLGGVGGGMASRGISRAAQEASLLAQGLSEEGASAITKLSPGESNYAKLVSALKTFREHISPAVQGPSPHGNSIAEDVVGASKALREDLGKSISSLKDEASVIQKDTGKFLKPDDFVSHVKEQAKKYGAEFDTSGKFDKASDLSKTAPPGMKDLLDLHDEAISSQYNPQGGMSIDRTEAMLKSLSDRAGYEKANKTGGDQLFSTARTALDADRVAHVAELFGGQDTHEAKMFTQFMADYSNNIKAHNLIEKQFNTQGKIDLFANALAKNTPKALDGLDAIEQVFGTQSTQFKNVKASVLDSLVDATARDGKINGDAMLGFVGKNKPLMSRLFAGDEKDLGIFKSILGQAKELQGAQEMTPKLAASISHFVDLAGHKLGLPGGKFVSTLSKLTGNNKSAIDATKEALLEQMQKAVGPAQKKIIMDQRAALNSFTSMADVVSVPIKKGDATGYLRQYLPAASSFGAAKAVEQAAAQQ